MNNIILYTILSAAAKSSACGDRQQQPVNNNKGVALRLQTEVVRVDYTALGQYPGSGFYGPIKILRFLNDNLRVLRRSAAEFQGLISEYLLLGGRYSVPGRRPHKGLVRINVLLLR